MEITEAQSVTLNSKHPEANSGAIEPIVREIAPGVGAIHWIESESEDLVLEVNGASPHSPESESIEGREGSSNSRSFQQEIMDRLRA